MPGSRLAPAPRRPGGIPLWIGSWGSKAGLRRVARLGDGWLASAYNTTPDGFRAAKESLSERLDSHGRDPGRFPNALATMWTWVTEDAREADRVLREVLAPLLRRDPDALRDQLCVGPAEKCAELLSRYAQAGCERVYLWPLGDEPQQIELGGDGSASRRPGVSQCAGGEGRAAFVAQRLAGARRGHEARVTVHASAEELGARQLSTSVTTSFPRTSPERRCRIAAGTSLSG